MAERILRPFPAPARDFAGTCERLRMNMLSIVSWQEWRSGPEAIVEADYVCVCAPGGNGSELAQEPDAVGRMQFCNYTSGKKCAPGGIRTPDLRIRSPLLYPTELRAHCNDYG